MAITFPRALPSVGVMKSSFEPQRIDYLSPEAGGRLGAVTAGIPIWQLVLTFNNLTGANVAELRAWVQAQRGAQHLFYGFDPDRVPPYAYCGGFRLMRRPDASSFDGSATSWSQAIDGTTGVATVTLHGLPKGFLVSIGDYLDFRWSTWKRALVRAVEPTVADTSGVASFAVEPPVPTTVVPSEAVASFDHPTCLMRLVTTGTKLPDQALGYSEAGATITGIQDLIP